ncbi:MAG: PDZ domain-containing protein [Thermodesulfobacteria bacterium]|nr:PDZ domain-containing protein [Thermodesulfobacteriota bacterium]
MRLIALVIGIVILFSGSPLAAQKKKETSLLTVPRVWTTARVIASKHMVSGETKIELPPRKVVWINVKNLTIKKVTLAGRVLEPEIENGYFRILSTSARQVLKVSFWAKFSGKGPNLISRKAIVLTQNWFPSVKGLAYYDLRITVPKRFKAIAPADRIDVTRKKTAFYHFRFPYPTEAPPLVAAPYHYYERKSGKVTLAVYLLKPNEKLARTYLDRARHYLRRYEKLIGPYPYRRFAVVENILPTGYAFPTFTLIGQAIIGLPFIAEISLRHEILHNWFGNGVYVDWERGNWCEALVTYLADHLSAEEKGEGADYRHFLLVNYESYVSPENDFPLKDFRFRSDPTAQAIGYGKGAMVFHMLRQRVGKDLFFKALRNLYEKYLFQAISWREIENCFEDVSRSSLGSFFNQWINRAGLPRLVFNRERLVPLKGDRYVVGLSIRQDEPYYELTIPLKVVSEKETKEILVFLSGPRTRVDVTLSGRPLYALLDPDYDLARHLAEPEFPPVIARVLAPRGGRIILTKKREISIYRPLISFFEKRGYRLELNVLSPEESAQNLIYLGEIPSKLSPLFSSLPAADFCLDVRENPVYPQNVVAVIQAKDRKSVESVLPKLPHLGRYQRICYRNNSLVEKKRPAYQHGIRVNLANEIRGVSLRDLYPLETIARAISLHRVIFLGEQHDRYEEHLAQLAIIKWLNEHGHKIAIGMEMFQASFQPVLDDYISGRIDEIEFLKRSEYFKRWGFNWRLYKPILDYARKHRIPVIALNVRSEITDKVAKKGLEALSPEEKSTLPEIDRENAAYREFLRLVYESHPENQKEIKDFETFYQAQLLWDETMAERIVSYLNKHPDRQMVVIAGRAHVAYGYGIPSRVARRGIEDYVIVLLSPGESLSPAMADYVLFPSPEKAPFTARLGVLIEETAEGLLIKKVLPGTPAEKAGLKPEDLILKADGKPVHSVADLKLILYQKGPKDRVELLIKRGKKTKKIKVGPFEEAKKPKGHH